eukprot:gene9447-17164_t
MSEIFSIGVEQCIILSNTICIQLRLSHATAAIRATALVIFHIQAGVQKHSKTLQKNRMNKDGEIIVFSDKYRSQSRNLKDAIEKLREMIEAASYVPEGPTEDTVKKILER